MSCRSGAVAPIRIILLSNFFSGMFPERTSLIECVGNVVGGPA